MTRGRPPHQTLDEAEEIALHRGAVIPVPGSRSDSFDIIICEEHRTIFVRVRRSITSFSDPLQILSHYRFDIARAHRLPLTAVTAREIWLRLKNGKWQFFLIRHDSIIEIQADGTYIPRAELPMIIPGPSPRKASAGGGFTPDEGE